MVLYLTSHENVEVLNFLQDSRNMIIKKLSGEFYLNKFIVREMRSLDHYKFVFIDIDCLKDNEDDIIGAFKAFKAIYMPKLVIIAKGIENALLSRVANESGVYNIIVSTDVEKVKEDIEMCLDDEEKFEDKIRKHVKRLNLKYVFTNDNTKIFVAGVKSRFSTTKVAINLATHIADLGIKVSYTEAERGYMSRIASHYDFKNSSYKYVDYYYKGNIPLEYNFNIVDIGLLSEKKLKAFSSLDVANIKIICATAKQSEFNDLISMLNSSDFADEDLNIILIYNSVKERNSMKKQLKDYRDNVHFISDSIGLFETENSDIFMQILNKFIVEK